MINSYEFGIVPNPPLVNVDKKYKSIFQPYVARNMLRLGNPIVDIKPDKLKEGRTIFIFELTEKFEKDLATVKKQ